MFYESNSLVKVTGRVFRLLLWLIFYRVQFCVDFVGRLSSSSSQSNLRLHCGARV